jgi:hypothetical protein
VGREVRERGEREEREREILCVISTPTCFSASAALKHVGVLMIYKILLIYSYAHITADSVPGVCCGPPKIGKSKK